MTPEPDIQRTEARAHLRHAEFFSHRAQHSLERADYQRAIKDCLQARSDPAAAIKSLVFLVDE